MRYTIPLAAAILSVSGPARAEVPVVVTDIPPVHALVAQVMGDLGAPVLMLGRGGAAHDVQLRPSQMAALADAGLVVWMGPRMSPWMDRALQGLGREAGALALLAVEGTVLRGQTADGGSDDLAGGEGRDPADGAADPHAWLDPGNAVLWLGVIAQELARADPANAGTYAANAAEAQAGVAALDAAVAARLAPVRDRPAVVFHDAYGYFADRYGLTILGAIAAGDAASPGAARLRDLQAAARGAVCVFPEANQDPALAARMAEAAGTRLGPPLDPEGALLDPGPGLYAGLMTGLAEGFAACLSAP